MPVVGVEQVVGPMIKMQRVAAVLEALGDDGVREQPVQTAQMTQDLVVVGLDTPSVLAVVAVPASSSSGTLPRERHR